MKAWTILFAACALVACGPAGWPQSAPSPDRPPGDHPAPPDAAPATVVAAAPVCPATFAEATALRVDCNAPGVGGALMCGYPEGACQCAYPPPQCSGMAPPPPTKDDYNWGCRGVPPAVRADGCPGKPPQDGTTCSAQGPQDCAYFESNPCGHHFKCMNGVWRQLVTQYPP